jgi:hypothetical protein
MNEGPARWATLGGMGFAILMVAGFLLQGDPNSTSDLEWRAYFDDNGNRISLFISMYVKVVAGVCLFAFLHRLRFLLEVEGGEGRMADVAYVTGLIFMVFYLASAAIFGALASTPMRLGEFDDQTPEVIRFSFHLGYIVWLVPGMFAASIMAASASYAGLRSRTFPVWFCWSGYAAAAVGLFSPFLVPAFAVPLWLAAASLQMWLRRSQARPGLAPEPA